MSSKYMKENAVPRAPEKEEADAAVEAVEAAADAIKAASQKNIPMKFT